MKSLLAALSALAILIPGCAWAEAVLYISPERGSYTAGQTFEIKVFADSGGALINAAEAELSFTSDALQVENISTEGSILQSWSSEPEFSNTDGTVHFAGWSKNNYRGVSGLLATIKFKALRASLAHARLAAGAILAADGQESNIITSMRSGSFTIAADEIVEAPTASSNTSSTIQAKIPAPSFSDYPDDVTVGDRIVLHGNAEPNAHVTVSLTHDNGEEVRTELLAAANGSFTYVSSDQATPGVYHVQASVRTEDGRTSVPTETIDVVSSSPGFAASAAFGVSLLFDILPFFAILVFGGLGAAYLFHRHQLAKMHYGKHRIFDEDSE